MADPEGPSRPAWSRESMVLRLPTIAGIEVLSREWAWGGATGAGVRVAVIDSGIEADHPDLEGCVDVDGGVEVKVAPDGTTQLVPGPHGDSFGHGTACASLIHAIAPEARLTSVRVLGSFGGKAAAFLHGLEWAIDQGFDVINLSLGSAKRDSALAFYELCDRAYFGGSLLVTAANNTWRPSYPSLFGAVTSVACSLSTDPFRFHWNPDPPTEFLARGVDVEVAWKGGGRITGTGNSYAAPHVAGIAALIRSKHPQLRPFQIKTVLWGTATNVQEAPVAPGRLTQALRATSTATGLHRTGRR